MLFLHLRAETVQDALRRGDTEVRHDQDLLELLIEIVIDLAPAEQRAQAVREIASRLAHAREQPLEEALFLNRFLLSHVFGCFLFPVQCLVRV